MVSYHAAGRISERQSSQRVFAICHLSFLISFEPKAGTTSQPESAYIGYRCKTIYPTNSILCSFDPKQVANRGMGLNQPQNDSARREFRMQRPQHPGARKIDRRRGWEITNNEDQRFSLSFYAIEHDSEHVVDIEVDESGLHPESEDTGNSLIILMAGEIREAARTRDTPQESDVRVRHASQEQQDRCDSGNENSFQDAEQEDTNQCFGRQPAKCSISERYRYRIGRECDTRKQIICIQRA
jgi:hypothetical protein